MQLHIDKLGKVSITVEQEYWSIDKDYDKLTVVEREGVFGTYLSRVPVPAGTPLTDRKYWIPFSSVKESLVLSFNDVLRRLEDLETGGAKSIADSEIIESAVKTDYVPIVRDGKVYLISLENLSILTSDIDNMLNNEAEVNDLLNALSNTRTVSTDSPNTYTTPTVIGSSQSIEQNGIRMFVLNINAINSANSRNIKPNDYIVDATNSTYIVASVSDDTVYCISNN